MPVASKNAPSGAIQLNSKKLPSSVPLQAGLRSGESGQVLPFVAVLLIVLLGMLALVLDGGNLYLHRRSMQNAADAGALAGARVLCYDGTYAQARAAAQDYAVARNGADEAIIGVDGWTVEVVARKDVAMTFARVLGINEVPVAAEAAAICAPAAGAKGLNPLSIPDVRYQISTPQQTHTYRIWDRDVDSITDVYGTPLYSPSGGSARGWLSLDCRLPDVCNEGESSLAGYLDDGYPGMIYVGDDVNKSSGVMAGLFKHVGEYLTIPVYDYIFDCGTSSTCYHIIKFARFKVEGVYTYKGDKYIQGQFVGFVTPSPVSEGPDGGVRTIALIR